MLDELNTLERDYLRGMALCMGDDRSVRTVDVARALGQLSRARDSLIGAGIILAPARGQVMFNVPHLADFVLKPQAMDEEVLLAKSWGL